MPIHTSSPSKGHALFDRFSASLLKPIEGNDGTVGAPLNHDPIYDAIKRERFEEDATLPQGIWQRDLKKADWTAAERLCLDALEFKSKDLQIAAWLTEAWIRIHGLSGMNAGLLIVHHLSSHFWDTIHPQVRAGDIEFRLAPFEWINEKITPLIRSLIVTNAPAAGYDKGISYTYGDWQEAKTLQNMAKMGKSGAGALKQAEQDGRLTITRFGAAQHDTATLFYQELAVEITSTLNTIAELESFVFGHCPGYGGILYKLRKEMEDLNHLIDTTLTKRGVHPKKSDGNPIIPHDPSIVQSPSPVFSTMKERTLGSREEAYELLGTIADYLSHIEPHSPTPYLIRRAMSWGRLSLTELLEEIVNDRGDLGKIFNLLGVGASSGPQPPPLSKASSTPGG